MILHTTEVKYLGGYRLWLAFNNGESGEVDLERELWGRGLRAFAGQGPVRHRPSTSCDENGCLGQGRRLSAGVFAGADARTKPASGLIQSDLLA